MKKLAGSYTVEATFIMSAILFTMVFLVKSAYRQCCQTGGSMRMHGMVEAARYREEEVSLTINHLNGQIIIEEAGNHIYGRLEGGGWDLSIESHIFAPEDFMRMVSLVQEQE